jgi:peptide/nickel transport system substrate-binding protein
MNADIQTLDPHVAFDNVSSIILDDLYEGLVAFDDSFRLRAGLAERWINPDDRTWRFLLRPDARFSDGSPLRASDVKFSIERLRSLAGTSDVSGFARHVVAVEAVDEHTVDVHTDAPIAILNSLALILIVSEAHVRTVGDRIAERPLGSGPYRLVRWERGRLIRLEANPYYRPQPPIARVEYLLRPGPAVAEEILTAQPDLAFFLRRASIPEIERRKPKGLKLVHGGEGLAVWYLVFNLRPQLPGQTRPNPLADIRVRRALALATDRDGLIREGLLGFGRPASQLVVPQVVGFNPAIQAPPFDPAAGRELLARSGQGHLELTLDIPDSGSQVSPGVLARQFQKIGARVSLRERTAAAHQRALQDGQFMLALQGYGCTSADASEVLLFGAHRREPAKGLGMGNYGGYANPEVDRIAESNLGVFDPRKRLELLQRALELTARDLALLPLYAAEEVYLVSDAIEWTPPLGEDMGVEKTRFRR